MSLFQDPAYIDLFASISGVQEHRAAFLTDIKAGSIPLADVFFRSAGDPALASMKVLPAIEALPETGKVSTRRAFGELGIDEAALICDVPADAIDALPDAIVRHTI